MLVLTLVIITTVFGCIKKTGNKVSNEDTNNDTNNNEIIRYYDISNAIENDIYDNSLIGPYGIKYTKNQTLRTLYSSEITTLNSFVSGNAVDWHGLSNCTEGLMSFDQYGNCVPALAESYTMSDDNTVYTFMLRKGVMWVDVEGNEVAELTADDFVVVAEFICNPKNAAASTIYFEDIIKGAKEYIAGESTDFNSVGFKALDNYTIEITLEGPLAYFISYCSNYLPAYEPLFKKLGDRYGTDNHSIYYIGPYLLTIFEPQSKRVYEKNKSYWDKDNVYIQKIIMTYNAEAYNLAPTMFLRGEIDVAQININILDEWMNNKKKKDIVIPGLPDITYVYYYAFNFDPRFDEEYEPDNWRIAVNNENFRQSLYWGLNRYKAKLTEDPYNTKMLLSNSITPITWCSVDGVDFTHIEPMLSITRRANFSFDETKALEYKEKAVKELKKAGATFPIKVLMPYNPVDTSWELEVQVVKQQLTKLLGSDYIECIIETGPSMGFLSEVRRTGKYAFMKCNNGATIDDPVAWLPAFAKGNSWTFLDKTRDPKTMSLVEEYYSKVKAGKEIYTKSMERYLKFAEAESFLLNHALVIPYSTDTTGYYVTRLNPFESEKSIVNRYKYCRVLEKPLTAEQFRLLYEDWLKFREKNK